MNTAENVFGVPTVKLKIRTDSKPRSTVNEDTDDTDAVRRFVGKTEMSPTTPRRLQTVDIAVY